MERQFDEIDFPTAVEVFRENFSVRSELGAAVSVWRDGVEELAISDGWCEREQVHAFTDRTLVPVYSATKGPAAATLLMVLHQHGLDAETPVREVWAKFPVAEASFGDLLSHQCGLAALGESAAILDHQACVQAIERTVPEWRPGEGHGYHPRTFGVLVDEPVRLLTGKPLGSVWRRELAEPLAIEWWIGLPESEWGRVARLYSAKVNPQTPLDKFYREFNRPGSLARRAFSSPQGLQGVGEMNLPRAWSAGLPAMGGVATAAAIAKFYQVAIGAIASPLDAEVLAELAEIRVSGPDRVLLQDTSFTCGCQRSPIDADGRPQRNTFGKSPAAFGHPGAGGSHGFGNPASGISFGYVMNQMEMSVMPGEKCQKLIDALAI